jgi:glycosyltransferase involved in cell wall biosynthesis
MKVLYVIPDLGYGSPARQLTLLAPRLPRDRFEPHVCVLGRPGPFGRVLQDAEVPVEVLHWVRLVDLAPLWQLRRRLKSLQPDMIHTWGPLALRAVGLVRAGRVGRLGVSAAGQGPRRKEKAGAALWDSRLLRRAAWVAVSNPAEEGRCRRLGVAPDRIVSVPLGVAANECSPGTDRPSGLDLPPQARLLVCVGPLLPHKGFRDAIWAFDILKYLYDDVQLLLIGDGPHRARLHQFAANIQALDRVHFLGQQADASAWLAAAHVVWMPSLSEGGCNVALEAMAAGRPVVASNLPGLAALVDEGRTGFLVPPGDKVALARQTRRLFDDDALRLRLAEAGRQRALEQFSVEAMVQRFVGLYDTP